MALERDAVVAALAKVKDPELFKDIITLNRVKGLRIEGDDVALQIELTTPGGQGKDVLTREIERALRDAGARGVQIEWSTNTRGQQTAAGQSAPSGARGPVSPSGNPLPQVRNIIAVGAGKGGVGKSTVAVNLAVGLARAGATVGLMDGDIYGPSMPTMLGIKNVPPEVRGPRILPHRVHGIHAITIGSLVEADKPLIWRGPMAHGAFKQLLLDNTEWPALDYLIVDLPPGTGDVPLTLCQLLPIKGAVVVATPQQVALDDAVRAVRMFQQLGAPILGLVENMSYFIGADGSEHDIFGRGGTARAAEQLGLTYLGAVPMFTDLRVNSDAGNPSANFTGNPRLRDALEQLTQSVANEVNNLNQQPLGPELTIS
jgi:ATP-binding protein involved in chromosome partitioning